MHDTHCTPHHPRPLARQPRALRRRSIAHALTGALGAASAAFRVARHDGPRRTASRARDRSTVGAGALALVLPLVLLLAACSPEPAPPAAAANAPGSGGTALGGTVVVASAAEPASLFPPVALTTQQLAVVDQLFDRLADVGDSLNVVGDVGFRPRLAQRWQWADDSLSISFTLDPRARWHDGRPVTARDVRFTYAVYTDPAVRSPLAPLLANLDSVTAPDSATAVFWYKRRTPQQFFDATYHMYVLPEHLLGRAPRAALARAPVGVGGEPFGRAPVGSGRFRFDEWRAAERLAIRADEGNARGRARLDRVVWQFAPDFGSATIALIAGDADFLEALRPETIGALARNQDVRVVAYPSLDYGFLQFNLRAGDGSVAPHPLFADRELRRALTFALDRERLVRNVFDSLAAPAVGPVPRALFGAWRRIAQLPHDPARARRTLDSLGWVPGPDGVRTRGGVPLAFTILVPTSSTLRERLAVLLQESLRPLGARVEVERVDIGTFVERQRARRFDAALGGWHTDPNPGSIRQTWGTIGARARGGSNFGAYENPVFDRHVTAALEALDPQRSEAEWLAAYQTIVDDAPAVWLFEPRLAAGAHRRLRLTGLRGDAWWAGLADWSIPGGERTARDRFGVR